MDDSWFADKFIQIAEDLGEIKAELSDTRDSQKEFDVRLRKIERQRNGSNKKLIALITAISTLIASVGATIAIIFNKVI